MTLLPQLFSRRRARALIGATAVLLGVLASGAGCGGSSSKSVAVVAYSSPQTAYENTLIPAFQKTSAGSGSKFTTSFGASGDQSRAVASGQSADVVHFSLQPDMQRVVDAGKVPANWNQNPNHGYITNSVVALIVRKGNPKHIASFDDLAKPGIKVLTPNPFTSGGARWNIMALYGSQIKEGKSPTQALDFVKAVLKNTPVQSSSARDALTAFTGGEGDVLIGYESDAIAAKKAGQAIDYILPKDSILIQTPIATTTKASKTAQAFVSFLYSNQGQQLWASLGYRPVNPALVNKKEFPTPAGLLTIAQLGGWTKVAKDFFDPTSGKVAAIEKTLGVSTSG